MLDDLATLNRLRFEQSGDPEITTRIAQYEMSYRMQTSVPELIDLSDEPEHIFKHKDLSVAINRRANADRRNRDFLGNF